MTSATGFRLIAGDITTLEVERRAAVLVGAVKAKANTAEGNAKVELLTILKEYLHGVRESASRSAKFASQQRMVDFDTKRQAKTELWNPLTDWTTTGLATHNTRRKRLC